MKKIIYTLGATAIVLLAACGGGYPTEGNKFELVITGAEKVTEQTDFFPNSDVSLNTDQINQKLDSLLKANNSDRKNLVDVKLTEVTLKITDTVNTFNVLKSLKVEVLADKSDVVAKKDSIQANGAKEIKLDASGLDFKEYLEKGDIFFNSSGNTGADTLKAPLKTVLIYKISVTAAPKK